MTARKHFKRNNPRVIRPLEERFWERVDKRGPNECWPWLGNITRQNRAVISVGALRKRPAAQVSWEIANGKPFPEGLWALHSCDNPNCVNPAHVRPGDVRDNLRDCVEHGRHPQAMKTHCAHGHPFDEANTIVRQKPDGRVHRKCRICTRAVCAASMARRRARLRAEIVCWQPPQHDHEEKR